MPSEQPLAVAATAAGLGPVREADDLGATHLVDDPGGDADVLVIGWGSTWGSIRAAIRRLRADGHKIAHAHLMYLNPFPRNTGDVVRAYPKVLVPEMNLGQLVKILRSEFLVDAHGLNKIQGKPFTVREIAAKLEEMSQ